MNLGGKKVTTITTKDGTHIYYKDWGKGQPIVFSHGWPLSADDGDGQMLFFGQRGHRTDGAMAARIRPGTPTKWTPTPTCRPFLKGPQQQLLRDQNQFVHAARAAKMHTVSTRAGEERT
jgi:pimeloyl-ACP methyl ester carboxylesterase